MTTVVLLKSGMMRKYHVPFCRAVEEVTPSLTLIYYAQNPVEIDEAIAALNSDI